MRFIAKAFGQQWGIWHVVEGKFQHCQRIKRLFDTDHHAGEDIAAGKGKQRFGNIAVVGVGVIKAQITGKATAADQRPYGAIITGDLSVENANALSALFHIRRGKQHLYQLRHVGAHLAHQFQRLQTLLFENIAANTTNQIQTVGFTRPGQQFRHRHRLFPHAEKLHKAGIKTNKMAGEAKVEQMTMQPFDFQQNRANSMRSLRHLNPQCIFNRVGIGHTVGKTANPTHAVG